MRNNPTDGSGNPNLFYLYGQASTDPVTTTVTAGEENAPAWNLVASSSSTAAPFNFNSSGITGTVNAKDTIVIPTDTAPILMTYEGSAWGYSWASNYVAQGGIPATKYYRVTTNTVPAGTGFWYVSRGGNPTITW